MTHKQKLSLQYRKDLVEKLVDISCSKYKVTKVILVEKFPYLKLHYFYGKRVVYFFVECDLLFDSTLEKTQIKGDNPVLMI